MLEQFCSNLLTVFMYSIFVGLSLWVIQLTGKAMEYVSDNYKDKEWINSILVFIDVVLITMILVLFGAMIIIMLPYIFIFLSIMMVISFIALIYVVISEKIKEHRKNKEE